MAGFGYKLPSIFIILVAAIIYTYTSNPAIAGLPGLEIKLSVFETQLFDFQSTFNNHQNKDLWNNLTMSGLITTDQFLDAAAYRHSVYGLNDQAPVSNERIQHIVERVLNVTPSAYNSQTTRVYLALGEEHRKVWAVMTDVAKEGILATAGEQVWNSFAGRFKAFSGAYGTAFFWEDGDTIDEFKTKHASTAHVMDLFSEQNNAMAQINLWTALELEGFGGNLQHNQAIPGVEAALRKHYGIQENWTLKAQLVFGGKAQPHPEGKEQLPSEKKVKVVL